MDLPVNDSLWQVIRVSKPVDLPVNDSLWQVIRVTLLTSGNTSYKSSLNQKSEQNQVNQSGFHFFCISISNELSCMLH